MKEISLLRSLMNVCNNQEIYKDRKKFSKNVFEVASSDLVNMGISVVSYTLKDVRDDQVSKERLRGYACIYEEPISKTSYIQS